MPPAALGPSSKPPSGRYLSFAEREELAILRVQGLGVREFVAKIHDIVGLYVAPPAHAVVLSVDEKSQIQALDRTQPGLPLKEGRCGTTTHEYKRNGTTTLFAR